MHNVKTAPSIVLVLGVLITLSCDPSAWAQFSFEAEPTEASVTSVFDADTALDESAAEDASVLNPILELRTSLRPFVDADDEEHEHEPVAARAWRAAEVEDPAEESSQVLGRLSANPFGADSTANPYSPAGSPYSTRSVNNPYGPYGSPYSPTSARNPYATDAPRIVAEDGTYLGRLSENRFDPDSTANPYGRYGSPYSTTSINNPYSPYGSPYSPQSPNNPYSTQAPLLFGD